MLQTTECRIAMSSFATKVRLNNKCIIKYRVTGILFSFKSKVAAILFLLFWATLACDEQH